MKRKRNTVDIIKDVNSLHILDFRKTHLPIEFTAPDSEQPSGQTPRVQLLVPPIVQGTCDDGETLSEPELDACVALVKETSGEDYSNSSLGWHQQRKRTEMNDKDMKFLVVRSQAPAPSTDDTPHGGDPFGGFASFMLTHEDGLPVIYIYEIHLQQHARGSGTGKMLMSLMEHIGLSVGVEKSMLTVFRRNDMAVKWYERLGYMVDKYSPQDKELRGGKVKQSDYLIMSKRLDEKLVKKDNMKS
ncbi:hypothetical protein CAC42_379 [Sphaceloma murrayae]|uniref:N-alpha-acetyltransferase 40 n=1 Tax=Sphaceloma murrayae TaxID=2082308 RepID=A0A2K1R3A9_9PEZI|nr:hypothetical protein CAC42_379 [Sphaceloma murrayae]